MDEAESYFDAKACIEVKYIGFICTAVPSSTNKLAAPVNVSFMPRLIVCVNVRPSDAAYATLKLKLDWVSKSSGLFEVILPLPLIEN